MIRKKYVTGLTCFVLFCLVVFSAESLQPIDGPWLWMIAPNEEGINISEFTDVDSLAIASGGTVTETDVITGNVAEGDSLGNYAWTLGTLTLEIDNINKLVNNIGMNLDRNLDDHSAYALINIESETDQFSVPMGANSDDTIKIWLNGEVVHKWPHARGYYGGENYVDNFHVDLKKGENLLLVKVVDRSGGWGMLVGIDANVTYKAPTRKDFTTVPSQPVMEQPEYVYWTDYLSGKVQRAYLDGSNVQDIITGLDRPVGISLDVANGKMYWNDWNGNNSIRRANLDGSNIELLVTGDESIKEELVLDLSSRKMYWIHWNEAQRGQNTIQRSNLDGTNIETLVSTLQSPKGLALDTTSGKMYWTDINRIQRANLDGTDVENLANVPGYLVYISLDIENQHIYWGNIWQYDSATSQQIPNSGKIQRANLDGSNLQDLVEGLQDPGGITLDLKNSKMYWTSIDHGGSQGAIQRANLDGTDVETIVTGLQRPVGIDLTVTPDIIPLVDSTVSISPTPIESPLIGQSFTVDINIVGGENIAGYQATVQFDENAVRFVSSSDGDFLLSDTYSTAPIVVGNTVTVAAASYRGETSGDGTLARLTFEVITETDSTLAITEVLLSNSTGMLTKPHLVDGQIIEPPYLREDVNRDGAVNILDMVYVSRRLGVTETTTADVNRDGSVDVRDLVLVAGSFGKVPSAASVLTHASGQLPTIAEVELWLEQARKLNLTDPKSLRGISFLEQLLQTLAPQETALLANYPNPFNPETWIPYQLAKPADVTLQIYTVEGNAVRTLSLGHQTAGIYLNRSRAAHWDGKNETGESVASGVYFYTLTAGEFTETRKMLILK